MDRGGGARPCFCRSRSWRCPLYLRYSDQLIALRAFGGLVVLLVWLYLMANIIVLGAEINWWVIFGCREPEAETEPESEPVGLA